LLRDYGALTPSRLRAGAGYAQPVTRVPETVVLDDPALRVMTDFRSVTAVVILPGDSVNEAHRRMIQRGVRLLLVVDQDRQVVGLITATDILGEKPMQVVTARGMRREELLVRDIMTPQQSLQAIGLSDVERAKVGHIVATLKQSGRHHAIVVEQDEAGRQSVRGLFSATQIARQLGVAIPTSEVARTFAEIEAQLAR
jgi:CBS-domain-containing membrane protein